MTCNFCNVFFSPNWVECQGRRETVCECGAVYFLIPSRKTFPVEQSPLAKCKAKPTVTVCGGFDNNAEILPNPSCRFTPRSL